jgi:hypothetical protein
MFEYNYEPMEEKEGEDVLLQQKLDFEQDMIEWEQETKKIKTKCQKKKCGVNIVYSKCDICVEPHIVNCPGCKECKYAEWINSKTPAFCRMLERKNQNEGKCYKYFWQGFHFSLIGKNITTLKVLRIIRHLHRVESFSWEKIPCEKGLRWKITIIFY